MPTIPQVWRVYDRVLAATSHWIDEVLSGDSLHRFAESVAKAVGGRADAASVYLSLAPLAGVRLTRPLFDETMLRLIGNRERLRDMQVVPIWKGQAGDEWCRAEILGSSLRNLPDGRLGRRLNLLLYGGWAAGLRCAPLWSDDFLISLSRSLGFSKPWRDLPYEDPRQLTGLHALALIDAVPCASSGLPAAKKLDAGSSELRWNRALLRARRDKDLADAAFRCPHKIADPCHRCPVGYEPGGAEALFCPIATHARMFGIRPCEVCGSKEAVFDFDDSEASCRACFRKLVFERRREKTRR